ncbi:hypothetical protein IMG5_013450 [Ichthyophthirius multifiliis]|uniref:Uncharacterized protein n=1 Tax=Ichthyophthirius multifiliis TaxID=5932 RepID=G0QK63_ICHMU|nr:hypothetical protein IMG5_013450 [Ichthyophthirius multifiliis]EGR34394.1 hypothetical protein IMG5_013450 [Ichthyophthirius multifiliis]|eukprot:XP_004039698.1 hypothetical protein IMG5_013450 [Ichthyophthirius multifiliis]
MHIGQPFVLNEQDILNIPNGSIQSITKEIAFIEPLLNAYDDKIEQLEHLLEITSEDYRDMQKKADFLIQDNNTLREELEKKCQFIISLYKNGNPINNIQNSYQKLEKDDLNEKIKILTQENTEFLQKFTEICVLKIKLKKLKKIKQKRLNISKCQFNLTLKVKNVQLQHKNIKNKLIIQKIFNQNTMIQ